MIRRRHAGAIIAVGLALLVGSCGNDALDPVVVFDLQPIEAQPWTATGELVDAGLLCSSGDREFLFVGYPDGSPMPVEEMMKLIDDAIEAGGSHENVARIGRMEYVCDDGSGTFTMTERMTGDPADEITSEVTRGSGAYLMMSGTCTQEEHTEGTEVVRLTNTCEFDLGSET
ncbi:MAG: hypothetical protein QNJ75_07830 [Acidimicrobiia bacterium]|nr:hypothetical protein [Acidimicrobiia bacterium]